LPVLKFCSYRCQVHRGPGGARRAGVSRNGSGRWLLGKEIARVKIPVGLDIGAETPEQIAIAIVGELLMVRTGKTIKAVRSASSSA
jgi:xanthine dehydrogenase accessory factor